MSLVTFEVEIDRGRVISGGAEPLPEKGTALLTFLPGDAPLSSRGSISEFIEKWGGAFSVPEIPADDLRLAYLRGKHAK